MWREDTKTWYFKKVVNGKREFNGRKTPFSLETSDVNVAKAKRDAILRAGNGAEIDRVVGRSSKPVAKLSDLEAAYLAADVPREQTRKKNLAALRRIVERAGQSWTTGTVADLTRDTVTKFQDWTVATARAKGHDDEGEDMLRNKYSADRTLIQARSIFAYERPFRALHMPRPAGFLEADLFDPPRDLRYTPMSAEELALFAAECFELKARALGAEDALERERASGIFALWLCMRYLGMRNIEVEFCRPREWIVRGPLGWLMRIQDRPEIRAQGELVAPAFRVKGAGSTRELPVADWLCAELLHLSAGRDFLLPGRTVTDRHEISHYALNEWMGEVYDRAIERGVLTPATGPRTAYDWRKQAGSEIYAKTRDILATSKWLGHTSVHTTTRWYVGLIQTLPSLG